MNHAIDLQNLDGLIVGNPDLTVEDVEAFALEAILSVNKNEIVKLWREKLMVMYPTVEQHEMVPFHDQD